MAWKDSIPRETWNKERIAQCESCQHSKSMHYDDIHEVCDAGICMLCYQVGRRGKNCDEYLPVETKVN